MDKNILLDQLTKAILESGFNKKFDKEDFIEIIKFSGIEVDNSRIELLQRWSKFLERVRDLPLKTRQDYAIQELIKTGIHEKYAIEVVNEIAKMVIETSQEKEEKIDYEQKSIIEKEISRESIKTKFDENLLVDEIIEDLESSSQNTNSDFSNTKDDLKTISEELFGEGFDPDLVQQTSRENPINNQHKETQNQKIGNKDKLIEKQELPKVIQGFSFNNQADQVNKLGTTQKNNKFHLKGIYGLLGMMVISLGCIVGLMVLNNSIIKTNSETNDVSELPQIQNTLLITPTKTYIQTASLTPIISNNKDIVLKEIEVFANEGWQNTNILLSKGQELSIKYKTGRWAPYLDILDLPYTTNPKEYPGSILSSASVWSLIGKIGNGAAFDVSSQIDFSVKNSGYLQLRINDDDYLDNTGSIKILVEVLPESNLSILPSNTIFILSNTSTPTLINQRASSTPTFNKRSKTLISEMTMDVSSRVSWASTKIDVLAGDQIKIQQISGQWTVDPRNFDMTDGDGYQGLRPKDSCDFCTAPIYEGRLGQLVAKVIGSSTVYPIGTQGEFVAPVDGLLCLMINDLYQSFGDNKGDLTVKISVYR